MKKSIIIIIVVAIVLLIFLIGQVFVSSYNRKKSDELLASANSISNETDEVQDSTNEISNKTNTESNSSSDIESESSEEEVGEFNSKFEAYSGTQTGESVKTLIKYVVDSNEEYSEDSQIAVNYLGKSHQTSSELTDLSSIIESEGKYKVSFEYTIKKTIGIVNVEKV